MAANTPPSDDRQQRAQAYWRANLRLIGTLLFFWAAVPYGLGILAVDWLNEWTIGQLPLGFWIAQQGSLYMFVVLVLVYAWQMQRLDKKYGLEE